MSLMFGGQLDVHSCSLSLECEAGSRVLAEHLPSLGKNRASNNLAGSNASLVCPSES